MTDEIAKSMAEQLLACVEQETRLLVESAVSDLSRAAFGVQLVEFSYDVEQMPDSSARRQFLRMLSDTEMTIATLSRKFAQKWKTDALLIAKEAVVETRVKHPQASLSSEVLFHAALEAIYRKLTERVAKIAAKSLEKCLGRLCTQIPFCPQKAAAAHKFDGRGR